MSLSHNACAPLNQTAAILMAAAVCDLFPGTLIVEGQGTPNCFFYDFVFPFEFQPQLIPLIEEQMRLIIREKRAIRTLEMMPSNAAALMEHSGQKMAAERLARVEQAVVQMCQIGEFRAYCPFPVLDKLAIDFFKIIERFPLNMSGRKIIRIVGAAAYDKESVKALGKQVSFSSRSHLTLAREVGFFEPMEEEGLWFWRPKGEILRRQLLDWWRSEHKTQNFSLIASPTSLIGEGGEESVRLSHQEYFLRLDAPKVAEVVWISSRDHVDSGAGLFSPKAFTADRAHLFCSDENLLDECISSLHFIFAIPKILGFEFEIVLSVSSEGAQKARARGAALLQKALEKVGVDYVVEKNYRMGILASVEVRFADSLGRRWTGPFLSVPEKALPMDRGNILVRSTFGSLERLVALLLEKRGGWLPFWMAPEQVRVLIASTNAGSYAKQVFDALKAQGVRATLESGEDTLKARIYRAILEKVPYIILLGEREEKAASLTVRAYGENEEESLSLDEFYMRLKREMRSGNSES